MNGAIKIFRFWYFRTIFYETDKLIWKKFYGCFPKIVIGKHLIDFYSKLTLSSANIIAKIYVIKLINNHNNKNDSLSHQCSSSRSHPKPKFGSRSPTRLWPAFSEYSSGVADESIFCKAEIRVVVVTPYLQKNNLIAFNEHWEKWM